MLNVLSSAIRGLKRGQGLSVQDAQEVMTAMNALKLEEHGIKGLEKRILELSREHQRSAYDAAYLALAEQLGVDLLTGDERLYNTMKARWKHVKFVGAYEALSTPP